MMRKWTKVLPFWVIEKICLGYTGDDGYMRGTRGEEIPIRFYDFADGTWIVKSQRIILEHRRQKLEEEIEEIDRKLGNQ